jgi:CheY-like chemotaxis protein
VLDANALVSELMRMLQRVIGEDVALEFLPCQAACRVNADAGLLEQVVMNLVVNARDAMPRGGRIVIATAQVALGDLAGRICPDLKPGPYAVLSVSDTGMGMDAGVLERVFEPFFTTKEPGKGTGLGLSTVYGIVRQSGGAVTVDSSPGHGSTFKVWLPSVAQAPEPEPAAEPDSPGAISAETILILDDDPQIRKVIARSLISKGYLTLEAATPQEALELCSRGRRIDLLLSDMVLSDRERGPEVARKLVALAPKMRIIFMSGYTDERAAQEELISFADAFLQKPISPETLSLKVREVLDSPRRGAA